jgi:ABC-2 type transport system ATP-binding protein
MIEIRNVTKRYGKRILFHGMNARFEDGRKIRICGINGIGKSVLLRMIVGTSRCTEGTIEADGRIIGRDIDFLPDAGVFINAPEFLGELSGLDNLKELASLKNTAEEDILDLADMFELSADLKRKYRTYSLGMRQKMRLIQALMDHPKYLILDEPFDSLDKETKYKAMDILQDYMMADTKRTLIYASHDGDTEGFADDEYEIENAGLRHR